MNKRTEKAIAAWLALPAKEKGLQWAQPGSIFLFRYPEGAMPYEVAAFTLASIIKKRYPARKKRKVRK